MTSFIPEEKKVIVLGDLSCVGVDRLRGLFHEATRLIEKIEGHQIHIDKKIKMNKSLFLDLWVFGEKVTELELDKLFYSKHSIYIFVVNLSNYCEENLNHLYKTIRKISSSAPVLFLCIGKLPKTIQKLTLPNGKNDDFIKFDLDQDIKGNRAIFRQKIIDIIENKDSNFIHRPNSDWQHLKCDFDKFEEPGFLIDNDWFEKKGLDNQNKEKFLDYINNNGWTVFNNPLDRENVYIITNPNLIVSVIFDIINKAKHGSDLKYAVSYEEIVKIVEEDNNLRGFFDVFLHIIETSGIGFLQDDAAFFPCALYDFRSSPKKEIIPCHALRIRFSHLSQDTIFNLIMVLFNRQVTIDERSDWKTEIIIESINSCEIIMKIQRNTHAIDILIGRGERARSCEIAGALIRDYIKDSVQGSAKTKYSVYFVLPYDMRVEAEYEELTRLDAQRNKIIKLSNGGKYKVKHFLEEYNASNYTLNGVANNIKEKIEQIFSRNSEQSTGKLTTRETSKSQTIIFTIICMCAIIGTWLTLLFFGYSNHFQFVCSLSVGLAFYGLWVILNPQYFYRRLVKALILGSSTISVLPYVYLYYVDPSIVSKINYVDLISFNWPTVVVIAILVFADVYMNRPQKN